MQRALRIASAAAVLALVAAILVPVLWSDGMASDDGKSAAPPSAIPLAVMGDSNSQAYQDSVSFPEGSAERGGAFRSRTFQWVEVLARLRGQELDLGPWVRWGRPGVVAEAREWLGLRGGRAPQKEDYLYNFANSGATCRALMGTRFRQAPRLVALMDQDPERWARGVVVIRIGVNDWGAYKLLIPQNPEAPELREVGAHCAGEIGRAIALIHASHPTTRILVVGVGSDGDDPAFFDHWRSEAETSHIRTALDRFNAALRKVVQDNPHVAFSDDFQWFLDRWGSRTPEGVPNYRTVAVGSHLRVVNAYGDDPNNTFLADGHPGLAFNVLWAQSLVARLKEAFGLPLTPISDEEIARFLDPLVAIPPRAPGP